MGYSSASRSIPSSIYREEGLVPYVSSSFYQKEVLSGIEFSTPLCPAAWQFGGWEKPRLESILNFNHCSVTLMLCDCGLVTYSSELPSSFFKVDNSTYLSEIVWGSTDLTCIIANTALEPNGHFLWCSCLWLVSSKRAVFLRNTFLSLQEISMLIDAITETSSGY